MANICESHAGFEFESITQTADELAVVEDAYDTPGNERIIGEAGFSEERSETSEVRETTPDVVYEADEVPEVTNELLELEQVPESMYVIKIKPRCSLANEEDLPNCANLSPNIVNKLENGDVICKLPGDGAESSQSSSPTDDCSDVMPLQTGVTEASTERVNTVQKTEKCSAATSEYTGESSKPSSPCKYRHNDRTVSTQAPSVRITLKDISPLTLTENLSHTTESGRDMDVIAEAQTVGDGFGYPSEDTKDSVGDSSQVNQSREIEPNSRESCEVNSKSEHVQFLEENGEVLYELENVPKDINELYLVHDPDSTSEHVILFYEADGQKESANLSRKYEDESQTVQLAKSNESDDDLMKTTSPEPASSQDTTIVDDLNSSDDLNMDIAEFAEVRTYRCQFCAEEFTGMEQFKHHVLLHIGEVALKCSMCDKDFSSCDICRMELLDSVDRSVTDTSVRTGYECDICNRQYVNSEALKSHSLNHSVENLYTCGICSRSVPTSDALIAHLMTHLWAEERAQRLANEANVSQAQPPAPTTVEKSKIAAMHQCSVCNMVFKSADGLKLHMYLHPSEERPPSKERKAPAVVKSAPVTSASQFRARDPSKRKIFKPLKMRQYVTFSGRNIRGEEEDEPMEIVVDDTSADEEQSLDSEPVAVAADTQTALTDESLPAVIKSEPVDVESNTSVNVREQDSSKASTKPQYHCTECDRSFAYQSNLTRHNLNVHNIGKSYRCDVCGEQFEVKASLRKHRLTHDSDSVQPHKCTICGHTFSRADRLTEHMAEHKSKSHACHVCGKLFSLSTTLQQHMMTHLQVEKQSPKALLKKSPARTPKKLVEKAAEQSSPIITNSPPIDTSLTASPKEKPIHKCHICHKTFIRGFTLQRHLLNIHRMTTKNNFKCDYCAKEFALEVNYKKHVLLHTDGKEYVCCICGDTFGRADRLDQHMLKHNADIKPVLPVPISTLTLPAPPIHATHVTYSIQPVLTSSPGLYIDQQTGQISQGMIQHLTLAPPPISPLQNLIRQSLNPMMTYQQPFMQTSISQDASVLNATILTSQAVQPQLNAGLAQSGFSSQLDHSNIPAKSKSNLLLKASPGKSSPVHKIKSPAKAALVKSSPSAKSGSPSKKKALKSLPGVKPLSTAKADPVKKKTPVSKQVKVMKPSAQTANTQSSSKTKGLTLSTVPSGSLKQMKTLHTSEKPIRVKEKPYKCSICNRQFSNINTLRDHMVSHSSKHQHVCEFCKKTFVRMNELRLHLSSHTGDKIFKCHLCGKEFARPGCLRAHVLIHTGEKRYECRTCKSRFTHVSTLRKHILTHTKEKPFQCNVCNQSFSQSGNMMRHMKSKHEQLAKTMQS